MAGISFYDFYRMLPASDAYKFNMYLSGEGEDLPTSITDKYFVPGMGDRVYIKSDVTKLASQIAGQRQQYDSEKYWQGDWRKGYSNISDLDNEMAVNLLSKDITNLSQIKSKQVPEYTVDGETGDFVPTGRTKNVAWNSVTNTELGKDNTWGTTGAGSGSFFKFNFDAHGNPVIYTQPKPDNGFLGTGFSFEEWAPAIMMMVPGIGQAIGAEIIAASGVTGASAGVANAIGNAAITLATTGGDVEKTLSSVAASYLGNQAGDAVGAVAAETFGSSVGKLIDNAVTAATKAIVLDKDPTQAVQSALINTGFSEASKIVGATPSAPVFEQPAAAPVQTSDELAQSFGWADEATRRYAEMNGFGNDPAIAQREILAVSEGFPNYATKEIYGGDIAAFKEAKANEMAEVSTKPEVSNSEIATVIEGQNGEQISFNNQGEVIAVTSPEGDILADATSPTFDSDAADQVLQNAGVTEPVEFAGPRLEEVTSPTELNIENLQSLLGPTGPNLPFTPSIVNPDYILNRPVDISDVVTPDDLSAQTGPLPIDTDLTSFVTDAAQEAGFDDKEIEEFVKETVPEIQREVYGQEAERVGPDFAAPVESDLGIIGTPEGLSPYGPQQPQEDLTELVKQIYGGVSPDNVLQIPTKPEEVMVGETPSEPAPEIIREIYGQESEPVGPNIGPNIAPVFEDEFIPVSGELPSEVMGPSRAPIVPVGEETEPAPVIDRDVIAPGLDLNSVADAAQKAGYSESEMQNLLKDLGETKPVTIPGETGDLVIDDKGQVDVQGKTEEIAEDTTRLPVIPVGEEQGTPPAIDRDVIYPGLDLNSIADTAKEAGYSEDEAKDLVADVGGATNVVEDLTGAPAGTVPQDLTPAEVKPVDNLGITDINDLLSNAAQEAGYTDDEIADLTYDEITLGDLVGSDTLLGGTVTDGDTIPGADTVPSGEEFRIEASGGTPIDADQGEAEAGAGLGTDLGVSDYDTLEGATGNDEVRIDASGGTPIDEIIDLSDQPVEGPQSGGGLEEETEPTNQGQAEEGTGLGPTIGEGVGADLNQPDTGWPDWLKGLFRNLVSQGTSPAQARNFAQGFLGSGTGTGIQSPGMLGPTYQPWYSEMPEFDITKAFSPTLYAMREEEPDAQAEEE